MLALGASLGTALPSALGLRCRRLVRAAMPPIVFALFLLAWVTFAVLACMRCRLFLARLRCAVPRSCFMAAGILGACAAIVFFRRACALRGFSLFIVGTVRARFRPCCLAHGGTAAGNLCCRFAPCCLACIGGVRCCARAAIPRRTFAPNACS
jgi:hypothetical protein